MPASDETAFQQIYRAYHPELVAYFRRRAHPDDAQDLAEEVFAVAWRRRSDVPEGRQALMWLYGVAWRTLSHHRRAMARRTRLNTRLEHLPMPEADPPDAQVVRQLEYERVLAAAGRLRPRDREILRLALWEDLSHRDIARVTGASVPAVKQRLFRAKRRLTREYVQLNNDHTTPATTRKGGDV